MREKILAVLITLFAVIPTSVITLYVTSNTDWWTYCVLLFGVIVFSLFYSHAWLSVKSLLVFIFLSCFASSAPYISFTVFMVLVGCSIFYLQCLKIKDLKPILTATRSIFYLTITLVCMQQFGIDKLLNFGRDIPTYISSLGNPMMAGTFIVCLGSILLIESKLYFIPLLLLGYIFKSTGCLLSVAVGGLILVMYKIRAKRAKIAIFALFLAVSVTFMVKNGDFYQFAFQDRWPAWRKTIQLSNKHPLLGYGIGTYRVIAPALMTLKDAGGTTNEWEYLGTHGNILAWRQAHNFYLQILFEVGYIGLALVMLLIGLTVYRLIKSKDVTLIAGAGILISNMAIHFPDRMVQTVLLLILFMALCHKRGEEWRLRH